MDYVCPVNEVEQQLKEAGEQLASPPSSTKDLLDLLDKTEQLLTFVGQAPSISMQGALVPSMGALVGDELMKHSDMDVRVSVASCLCEISRITAPEPPYKDEIMKEIFQLNVMAFGELSNLTGHRYYKAVHILESVAKVKSCLLMLDLECDALVLEMFEQFLCTIRINHPHTVFSDMQTIMTLIIEESDEIATELLSLLISHVRKEKQIVSPVPWKLAENVLRNCIDTLKSYSETIMKLIKSNPDNYTVVVTLLCQNAYGKELEVTKSTKTNSIHKRDLNTMENGGSTKKQKNIDTQVVAKKIDRNRLKGKELETSQNLNSAHKSHSSKGRPKNKKNKLNQDSIPNLGQNSKEDSKRTRFQESKGMKGSTGKTKGNIETSGSLYNVVIKEEDEVLFDYGGATPFMPQMNDKMQNRRKLSFKKHVAGGSRGKDLKDAYIPEKHGEELVGHRIKVWWPLDKMYYEGAVSSYNPLDKKHKVLYADGDEEVLNLCDEKWILLDETSLNQEQIADLPSPMTTSPKQLKQKGKRKLESSPMQECNSNSPKSSAPAYSPKSKPTKEDENKGANTSTMDILCTVVENQKDDSVQTLDISCGQKPTENTINKVDQDVDPNPSGELVEQRLPEASETTQRLERSDELNCET